MKRFQFLVMPLCLSLLISALSPEKDSASDMEIVGIPCTSPGQHPVIAIVGGIGPSRNSGKALTISLFKALQDTNNSATQALLARCGLFLVFDPAPNATDRPGSGMVVNATPTDDDHDGRTDEDGPEDLNGDGYITQLRVKDPAGKWRAHPLDPRVLIPVKPELNEQGEYSVYIEGVDSDGDRQWNEDGPGGVDFNRNWTWNYPENQPGAGPWPVSEPETRAVADFLYDHPEIAVVYTLGPQDNLATPWSAGNDGGAIKTGVLAGDAPVLKYISEQHKKAIPTEGAPPGASGDGSFGYWAYFHYGRWSLMAQPWWVPPVEKKEEVKPESQSSQGPAPASAKDVITENGRAEAPAPSDSKPTEPTAAPAEPAKPVWDEKDERGKADIRKLEWLAEQGVEGFAPWTLIEHPDFPGREVEVGGFREALIESRAAEQVDATKQLEFLSTVASLLPQLSIDNVKTTALGGGVWRIEARVVNTGFLPTVSEMGELSQQHQRLQAMLTLPTGADFVKGRARESVPRLLGSGGSHELSWLVSGLKPDAKLTLEVSAPAVGSASTTIPIGGAK